MTEDKEWPPYIEAHRGPGGGAMFMRPDWPGHVFYRYIRADLVPHTHDWRASGIVGRIRKCAICGAEDYNPDFIEDTPHD